MFGLQRFEQSLRGGDELAPGGGKTLAALAKIHKHCTGKAHAHGCADHHTRQLALAKSDSSASIQSRKSNGSFRADCIIEIKEAPDRPNGGDGVACTKSFSNSTSSYEGHSDTDSENTKPNSQENGRTPKPGDRLFALSTKASLAKTARMRYGEDEMNSSWHDELDGERPRPFVRSQSMRNPTAKKPQVVTVEEAKSDGSANDEDLANAVLFDKKATSTKAGVSRKNSNGSQPIKPKLNGSPKPPWRGACGRPGAPEPLSRCASLRGSQRRPRLGDAVPWRRLYELSLWRKCGVSFAAAGADTERALLRSWSDLSRGEAPVHDYSAKSEEQLATEQEWLSARRMWLAHRGGFAAVAREGEAEGGRVRVRVLQTGEMLTVDEDDLEKANPPQLERCEDVAALRYLTECGALHVLRARHAAGAPHARAGHALLALGPPRRNAPIYTDKVASMFRGCRAEDMPPHVFASAQAAHRCMLAARRDRAVVFLGRSGSGKTSAMRHCAWYLATAYAAPATKLTADRLDAAFHCLEAFGNCRSTSNPNASRFVSLVSLDFDGGGALVSASVQTLLPDLKPPQESTFHALQWLVHGCDGRLRRELLLDKAPQAACPCAAPPAPAADAPAELAALEAALGRAGVAEKERRALWQALAAVCHLAWAGVAKAPAGCALKYQWADAASAERAARLLGAAPEELARAAFSAAAGTPQPAPRNNLRTPSPSTDRELTGAEALDGLIVGLYTEVFNIVAALINRGLTTSARTSSSILLLDAPGADNPMCAGQQSGAGLSRLMANYLQERLQLVFHEATLVAPRERYAQEGITLAGDGADDDWLSETVNPGPMVELLDKPPQNTLVRSSQNDLRECDRRGLLWLLDEEAMYPGSSDDTFLERVLAHYAAPARGAPAPPGAALHHLIKKAPHARQLVLQHLQGTNPVLYDVTGWVKASRENPVTKKALPLLQESQNEELAQLASWARGCGSGAGGAALGDAATLRRASSIRRSLGTAGAKRRSPALQAKFVADGLVDTLRRCGAGGVRFVCCLLAEHRGDGAGEINVPLLRSQFRGFQLLDAARLYKQGFPEHMPLAEFARRYRLLAQAADGEGGGDAVPAGASDRQLAEDTLPALDLDISSYRLGLTQVGV